VRTEGKNHSSFSNSFQYNLVRKVSAKLGLRKAWILKSLAPLRRSHVFCFGNRKDALRAPQELANCTHGKLRDMKA
jgi:hypothetical protein